MSGNNSTQSDEYRSQNTSASGTEELPHILEDVPDELKRASQWVCWNEGEDAKQAINPRTGEAMNAADAATTLDEVEDWLSEYEGLGFVVSSNDSYIGIRLANAAVGDDLDVAEWAGEIIERMDSYTELGPSESDILIVAKGELPDGEFVSDRVTFTASGLLPVTGRVCKGYDSLNWCQKALESIFEEHNEYEPEEEDEEEAPIEVDEDVTLTDVREPVVKNFDEAQWHLTEAILSTHATLFISGIQNCVGLIVVGDSGAGKTTGLKFFQGLDEQFYRSDDVTPASFVSHDALLTDEELEDVDLLPRVKHKSVLCRDMETWFAGDRDSIRSTMSRMTHLMDGEGFTRDSGSHGQRGYKGDFRFSFIGASTPLSPRSWKVMGNAGYRFVFFHKESREDSRETLKESLFGETTYQEQVENCRHAVLSFLHLLWEEYDGYGGVPDSDISATDEAQEAIAYLARVVKFCRATIGEDDTPKREDSHRIGAVLRDIAKGRALLNERKEVTVDDVVVSARVALSTMPSKRRPLVRALLNPATGHSLSTSEATAALGTSKPTTLTRMKELDTLGIAEFEESEEDGRSPKRLVLKSEFEWLDALPFPER